MSLKHCNNLKINFNKINLGKDSCWYIEIIICIDQFFQNQPMICSCRNSWFYSGTSTKNKFSSLSNQVLPDLSTVLIEEVYTQRDNNLSLLQVTNKLGRLGFSKFNILPGFKERRSRGNHLKEFWKKIRPKVPTHS